MRQDQFEKLQARAEQLVDVFIAESDPEKWPGQGIEPAKMDKSTRGDRYWCKKDAVATLACATRILGLVQVIRERAVPVNPAADGAPGAVAGDVPDELDQALADAEKEAQALLDKVGRGALKAEFDKRALGKK